MRNGWKKTRKRAKVEQAQKDWEYKSEKLTEGRSCKCESQTNWVKNLWEKYECESHSKEVYYMNGVYLTVTMTDLSF